MRHDEIEKEKDNEDSDSAAYDPKLQTLDYPEEESIVNMKLHHDYIQNICGTNLPPELSPDHLVEAVNDPVCCAGNKCEISDKLPY